VTLTTPDLYEVLEVPPRADRTTVARAWRMKRDRVEALRGELRDVEAEALCAKLDEAFAILANPRREARYLAYLRGAPPERDLFGGVEFEASGGVRPSAPTTAERHGVLQALLDPPDPSIPPWAEPPMIDDPLVAPDLSTPSKEWELDEVPGTAFIDAGARSAVRPNLPVAAAQRRSIEARKQAADERLLKALTTPPWRL